MLLMLFDFQITCKRKSRELDVHREELKYLEKNNNELKEKVKVSDSNDFK